jgi:hypothetical protein
MPFAAITRAMRSPMRWNSSGDGYSTSYDFPIRSASRAAKIDRERVVAVLDHAVARQHEAERREVERSLVRGRGMARAGDGKCLCILRIVPHPRRIVPFQASRGGWPRHKNSAPAGIAGHA